MWTTALYCFLTDAFRPPFRTSHWLVLLYVVLSIVYNPGSYFNRWILPDTDDYIRFVQVFNWLDGQSWWDMRLPHLYPEHTIVMHWARLVDIPLAGLLLVLEGFNRFFQWNAERQGLAMLVAFLVPCGILTALLYSVRMMARPLLGKRMAGLACFFVPLCLQLVFQFMPMRVDHHAYVILSAVVAFTGLQHLVLGLHTRRVMVVAGLSLALGMWNGAEILPMVAGFCLGLTALLLWQRRYTLFTLCLLFGLSLFLFNGLFLLIARAPDAWLAIEYDTFSFFYVILAGMAALYFAVLFAASRLTLNPWLLGALAMFTGLAELAALLQAFPDFIGGPYARVNPLLNQIFFPHIREAVPFINAWYDVAANFTVAPGHAVGSGLYFIMTRLFTPVLGLAAALHYGFRQDMLPRARRLWLVYAFFVLFFLLLAMFWQIRVISYAQVFAIPPLVFMLLRSLRALQAHYGGRRLFGWEVVTVLSFTILPVLIVPGIIMQNRFNPDILFYLGSQGNMPCADRLKIISHLQEMEEKGKHAVIMAPMDYTPELMFYTKHDFIAAPYHRNDRGIADMAFFYRSTGDDSAARRIARQDKLDYVLVCKKSSFQGTLSSQRESRSFTVNAGTNALEEKPSQKELEQGSLGMRLAFNAPPPWLEAEPILFENDFALYAVKKDKLNEPTRWPADKKK
jgi:hypothetical protein